MLFCPVEQPQLIGVIITHYDAVKATLLSIVGLKGLIYTRLSLKLQLSHLQRIINNSPSLIIHWKKLGRCVIWIGN